jgi:hypothetical protein
LFSAAFPGWEAGKHICRANLATFRDTYVEALHKRQRGELRDLDRQVLGSLQSGQLVSRTSLTQLRKQRHLGNAWPITWQPSAAAARVTELLVAATNSTLSHLTPNYRLFIDLLDVLVTDAASLFSSLSDRALRRRAVLRWRTSSSSSAILLTIRAVLSNGVSFFGPLNVKSVILSSLVID